MMKGKIPDLAEGEMMISVPKVFLSVIVVVSVIVWWIGGCGLIGKAMHAQAMEYNEIYTGGDEEEDPQETNDQGDSKLPTLKKRK